MTTTPILTPVQRAYVAVFASDSDPSVAQMCLAVSRLTDAIKSARKWLATYETPYTHFLIFNDDDAPLAWPVAQLSEYVLANGVQAVNA